MIARRRRGNACAANVLSPPSARSGRPCTSASTRFSSGGISIARSPGCGPSLSPIRGGPPELTP